jgi:hypothetical protein
MPPENKPKDKTDKNQDYQQLVRKIADRVWEMWQEDMRRGRERRGQVRRN